MFERGYMEGHRIAENMSPKFVASVRLDDSAAPTRQDWLDRVQLLHACLLKHLTLRLGRQDAEDVLQEFYLRVIRYRPQLGGEASVKSFIYRVLRSVVADHFRRLAAQTKVVAAIECHWEAPASEWSGESTAFDRLRGLLGGLPPQYSTLIERVDIGDESRSDVAATLGITTNNLAVRLLRARSALRSRATMLSISSPNDDPGNSLCSPTQSVAS